MPTSSLVATASRIFGLYLFVLVALELRYVIYSIFLEIGSPSSRDDVWLPIIAPVFGIIFNIVAGLILIYKADQIAERLHAPTTNNINISLTKLDILEITMISIGVIAIISAVPVILQQIVSYAYFNDYEPHERRFFWDSNNTATMIFSAFKLVAGFFLILNARYFARRLQRVGEREDAR